MFRFWLAPPSWLICVMIKTLYNFLDQGGGSDHQKNCSVPCVIINISFKVNQNLSIFLHVILPTNKQTCEKGNLLGLFRAINSMNVTEPIESMF